MIEDLHLKDQHEYSHAHEYTCVTCGDLICRHVAPLSARATLAHDKNMYFNEFNSNKSILNSESLEKIHKNP